MKLILVFFGCRIDTFKKYFLSSYVNVRDTDKFYLEHVYYQVIVENSIGLGRLFYYPIIDGVSGSTGKTYHLTRFVAFIGQSFLIWVDIQ